MIPIHLSMKNFCSHSFTEFSFEDFDSAVIIGKIRGSDKYSNGSGKSSIFNALEYVLFNEIKFSSLDKIIREGEESCSVEFQFQSSVDFQKYKIVRSNSASSGSDVRLFRYGNNLWEDITQRRPSDTDKEISKSLGFNYKTFCASSIFVQPGSENNIQKEFSNLPSITPEKRKAVLREIIRVSHYSQYEKVAKQKLTDLQSSLGKLNFSISLNQESVSEEEAIKKSYKELLEVSLELNSNRQKLVEEKTNVDKIIEKYKNDNYDLINRLKILNSDIKSASSQISVLENTASQCESKIISYSKLLEQEEAAKDNIKDSILTLEKELSDYRSFDLQELKKTSNILQEYKSKNAIAKSKLKEYESFQLNYNSCEHCLQPITEEYRQKTFCKYENLKKTLLHEIDSNNLEIKKLDDKILSLETVKKNKDNCINKISILKEKLKSSISRIENNSNNLNEANNLLQYTKNQIINGRDGLVAKTNDFNILNDEYKKLQEGSRIKDLDFRSKEITEEIKIIDSSILSVEKNNSVSEHKLKTIDNLKIKIAEDKSAKKELDAKLKVLQKVIIAFGSSGIPSMIISSALDDLQEYSNSWLSKIRPGLQLQFVVSKNKSNGEIDDTMDIVYFVDGSEREYKQLSGAQKIIISFAIKLGILEVINKRMGISIKLLLLDEADQSLDEGGLETFGEIIKKIQNDYKVLVITHNGYLKNKFTNFITVEQDDNNVSTAKLARA